MKSFSAVFATALSVKVHQGLLMEGAMPATMPSAEEVMRDCIGMVQFYSAIANIQNNTLLYSQNQGTVGNYVLRENVYAFGEYTLDDGRTIVVPKASYTQRIKDYAPITYASSLLMDLVRPKFPVSSLAVAGYKRTDPQSVTEYVFDAPVDITDIETVSNLITAVSGTCTYKMEVFDGSVWTEVIAQTTVPTTVTINMTITKARITRLSAGTAIINESSGIVPIFVGSFSDANKRDVRTATWLAVMLTDTASLGSTAELISAALPNYAASEGTFIFGVPIVDDIANYVSGTTVLVSKSQNVNPKDEIIVYPFEVSIKNFTGVAA